MPNDCIAEGFFGVVNLAFQMRRGERMVWFLRINFPRYCDCFREKKVKREKEIQKHAKDHVFQLVFLIGGELCILFKNSKTENGRRSKPYWKCETDDSERHETFLSKNIQETAQRKDLEKGAKGTLFPLQCAINSTRSILTKPQLT